MKKILDLIIGLVGLYVFAIAYEEPKAGVPLLLLGILMMAYAFIQLIRKNENHK